MADVKVNTLFRKKGNLSPTQMIVFSFAGIIFIGTILLILPWTTHGANLSLVDALFTAVSATCVTGLSVVNIGSEFTLYGQLVILVLIQLGGLGIMTFSTFFLYLFGGKVSIRGREAVDLTLSHSSAQNIGLLLRRIIVLVFWVEFTGVLFLTLGLLEFNSLPNALYYALFHAVSAFCNAGFSLYKNSFEGFKTDILINVVTMGLIIAGGLGFIVLFDLKNLFKNQENKFHRLSFHSKVVFSITILLIIFGTVLLFLVERPNSLNGIKSSTSALIALFQSVTARTAGFNTIPINTLTNGGCLILMFLMFVGAAPGSCGGGVKVSTLAIFIAVFFSRVKGYEEFNLFHRSIPRETISKAMVILLSAVLLISLFSFGLFLTEDWSVSPLESRGHFLELLFEAISAFGTVGLSMGVTPKLTVGGRLLIILLMFVGRLGPLTMAVALTRSRIKGRFRYAKEDIMVG